MTEVHETCFNPFQGNYCFETRGADAGGPSMMRANTTPGERTLADSVAGEGWKTHPRAGFRYKTGTAEPFADCKLLT